MPSRRSKRTKAASGGPNSQQESKYDDDLTYVVESSDDNTSNDEQLEVVGIPSTKSISRMFINLMFQNAKYAEKKNKRNNDSDNRQSTKESRGRKKGTIETQEWVCILEMISISFFCE